MPKATIVTDAYSWLTTEGPADNPRTIHHHERKGATIDVSAAELDRGRELLALVPAADDAELTVGQVGPDTSANPADQVAMSAGLVRPDGSAGPNASDREAVIAAARQQVAGAVARGDYDLPGDRADDLDADDEAEVARRTAELAGLTPADDGADGNGYPTSDKADDELRTMNAADLVAHVNQFPGDVERVATLEAERGAKARSSVNEAIENHRRAPTAPGA